jgi:predicted tellurium resistance membrane protein TerC
METFADPQIWAALLTLTALEIVLGVDNIIFISILTAKLPKDRQPTARRLGLAMAMIMRIALLASIAWVMKLTAPLLHVAGHGISGRDLILIVGGLFLLAKSTHEIHDKLEGDEHEGKARPKASFTSVIIQITALDIVFSLDSVITAVGMSSNMAVMVTAMTTAIRR